MKRQSIVFILLLLQVLFIFIGCGSSEKSASPQEPAVAAQEASAVTEEAAVEEAAAPSEVSSVFSDFIASSFLASSEFSTLTQFLLK